jgi:NADPH-dependent ferric siderophore reductase
VASIITQVRAKLAVEQFTVIETVPVTPSLVRVVVAATATRLASIAPGMHFALCVDGAGGLVSSTWRRFTISDVDYEGETFEWVGYLVGDRPAAKWIRQARPGLHVYIRLVEKDRPPIVSSRLILVGDETAIGTFIALSAKTNQPVVNAAVLHTCNPEDAMIPGVESSLITHCPTLDDVASEISRLLSGDPAAVVWVAGGRQLVGVVRTVVNGMDGRRILVARTYWSEGKRGME